MVALSPYPRGFLIYRATRALQPPSDWATIELGASGWIFAHSPMITPSVRRSEDGRRWVVAFGLFLYAGDDDVDTVDAAEDSPAPCAAHRLMTALEDGLERFLDLLDDFGGRHLVIRGDDDGVTLYQDATGMRTVYFSADAALVSSHLNLINELVPHRERTPREGRAGFMTAWGRTPRIGIEAMLPNHALTLGTWAIERFFPRRPNAYTHMSVAERVELFQRRWDRMLVDLTALDAELIMSITGGWDSRTSMALSRKHLDRMRLFTYSSRTPSGHARRSLISLDENVVNKLLDHLPATNHEYFYIEDRHGALTSEQKRAVQRNTIGRHGSWLLPHYLRSFPGEVIHLRGNASAVGKSSWTDAGAQNSREDIEQYWLRRTDDDAAHMRHEDRVREFSEGYEKWGYDQELFDTHRRDLFYWEIRLGRWSAEICNETDLAFETCAAMNVRSLLEMTLSFPIEQRKSSFFFAELINNVFPVLNFVGVNDERNLYEITRDARTQDERTQPTATTDTRLPVGYTGPTPEPRLSVSHHGRALATVEAEHELLRIPTEYFRVNHVLSRDFTPVSVPGTLSFTLLSRYGHEQSGGNWRYQIWVNDRLRASWDGGVSKEPVHVTIADLSAGDVPTVAAIAERDHPKGSWERASRMWLADLSFLPRPTTTAPSVTVDAPGAVHSGVTTHPLVHRGDIGALSPNDFPTDQPTRLDVDLGRGILPLLVVRREAQKSVTLFDGPVDLTTSFGVPAFQRSGWWKEIPWHQIHVADPGSVGPQALKTTWGQLDLDTSAMADAAKVVQQLATLLGVPRAVDRSYFGSSSGGFWAWNAALLDPGSRTVVSNPQIDWTTWSPSLVTGLLERRMGGIDIGAFRRRHPQRCNVLEAWQAAGEPIRVDYWVNTATPYERDVELPRVRAFQAAHPDLAANLSIHDYDDERAVHAPLDRRRALSAILEF